MKKSLTNQKFDEDLSTMPRINRERVFRAFGHFGYKEDVKNAQVTVLRQTAFPFKRVTIPVAKNLSIELIKLYLEDVKIDYDAFLHIIQN